MKEAMEYLGLTGEIRVVEDRNYAGTYPDIWVKGRTITVTGEWARQNMRERAKRLLHELIHLTGMAHNSRIGYYSHPAKDTYTPKVMKAFRRWKLLRDKVGK